MKKRIGFFAIVSLLFIGCHSDNDMKYKDTEKNGDTTKNPVGIENVNGNIPDTVNTIDIGTNKKDSTGKTGADSSK